MRPSLELPSIYPCADLTENKRSACLNRKEEHQLPAKEVDYLLTFVFCEIHVAVEGSSTRVFDEGMSCRLASK